MHPMKQLYKRHKIAAKLGAWINIQQESPKFAVINSLPLA